MKKLPDLTRTRLAVRAFDDAYAKPLQARSDIEHLAKLGEDVGRAYGLDTADRNSPDTCTQCVRPGAPNPVGGRPNLSFVRRMLALQETANE